MWVILRETVQYFYVDEVGWVINRRSIVKNLVGLELISRNVLRIKLIIDKSIDDLGLSHKTGAKDTDSNCLYVLVSARWFCFFTHLKLYFFFINFIIINDHATTAPAKSPAQLPAIVAKRSVVI